MTMFDLSGEHIIEIGGHATDMFDQMCTVPIDHCPMSPQEYAEHVRPEIQSTLRRLGSEALQNTLTDTDL